jgi:hypothetical protein
MGQVAWYQEPTNESSLTTISGFVALGLLFRALRKLRDTTLAAPLLWGCAAITAALFAAWADNAFFNYAAAVLFVVPTLALLGAKRPQNGAWQFIVATLVGILLLPVLLGVVFGDARPEPHLLFRWLVAAHIVVSVMNYLQTRYAGPAIVFGAAQVAVTLETVFLPQNPPWYAMHGTLAGTVGATIALAWATSLAEKSNGGPTGVQRLWLDFRDAYGLVWGLRVAERLNVAAKQHGWPVEFTWGGMVVNTESGALEPDVQHRIERELRSHLRRFVSHDWIARRLTG